jgi:hypothetical protein
MRYNDQLSVRVKAPLKQDLNKACEKYDVGEGTIVRHALVQFLDNLNTAPEQNKHLFV